MQVSSQIATAVENALVYGQLQKLKDNFGEERVYLDDEIRIELNFEEIVGRSAALQRVLHQVEVVAPTNSGVLIFLHVFPLPVPPLRDRREDIPPPGCAITWTSTPGK